MNSKLKFVFAAITLLILSTLACSIEGVSPFAAATPTEDLYQSVSLNSFFNDTLFADYPVTVRIPKELMMVEGNNGFYYWASEKDVESFKAGGNLNENFFGGSISNQIGFDKENNIFTEAPNVDADVAAFEADNEMKVLSYERRDIGGFPVLILDLEPYESLNFPFARLGMVYIASPDTTDATVFLIYFFPEDKALGDQVWRAFTDSLR